MHLNQIFYFSLPYSIFIARASLFAPTSSQTMPEGEREWVSRSLECSMLWNSSIFFLHRCWNIYLHKTRKKINVFFSRLLVLNRFGIIEQIAQNLSVSILGTQAPNPCITIHSPFMHFIYTISYSPNCKSSFVLCTVCVIDICRFCDGFDVYYFFSSSSFFVSSICLPNSDCCVCSLQIVV